MKRFEKRIELVVRPEGERVVAPEEREVIRDLEHVLIERVLLREALDSDGHALALAIERFDVDLGEDREVGRPLVPLTLVRDAEHVGGRGAEPAVELYHRGIGHGVERVPLAGQPDLPGVAADPRCEFAFTWLCRTMRWLLSDRLKSRRVKNFRSSVSRWRLSSKRPGS